MKKNKLDIVYEDKSIIVINKPSHLLTISTDNEKEKTLFQNSRNSVIRDIETGYHWIIDIWLFH